MTTTASAGSNTTVRFRETCSANGSPPTPRPAVDQWVRRLYVTPETGELVAMDSRARPFDGKLAEFLRLRDQRCRTPYCDAPIRHLDHAEDHAKGGPTGAVNGQGALRSLQLRQAGDRLDRPTASRTTPHRRDRHSDRTPLHEHRSGMVCGRTRPSDPVGYVLTA